MKRTIAILTFMLASMSFVSPASAHKASYDTIHPYKTKYCDVQYQYGYLWGVPYGRVRLTETGGKICKIQMSITIKRNGEWISIGTNLSANNTRTWQGVRGRLYEPLLGIQFVINQYSSSGRFERNVIHQCTPFG